MAAAQLMKVATVEDEIRKHPDMKMEYLQIFRDWVKKQPHFPRLDDDLLLVQYLRRCRYSVEMAKNKLDNYLTFRTHYPEMCLHRTVDQPDMESMLANWQHVLLPKRDDNGNVVIVIRTLTPDASSYNPSTSIKIIMTIIECYVRENGTIPGYVVIFDSTNLTLGHLARYTFTLCRQLLFFIQKCSPVSVKGVYNVNSHSLAETALAFIKSVSSGNIVNKVQVFPQGSIEGLYEHVPREILPQEYGGESATMDKLHREAYDAIRRVSGYTTAADKLKVDERKRTGVKINFGSIFGVEGSFKKLNVD